VSAGDPSTLEIKGVFKLTPGAIVRSLLLWNGTKILKAKLLDKDKADSIINQIVNYTYRDPALIKYQGNNSYLYRIYPVAINNMRKVRLLYTIPLQSQKGILHSEIRSAFTLGAQAVPTQIPVEFVNTESPSPRYILQHKNVKKSIQFGATYLIPFSDFYEGENYNWRYPTPLPLMITPDTQSSNKAYTYTIESGKAAGNYSALFSSVPNSLKKLIEESLLYDYTLEVKIQTSDNSFVTDVPINASFGIYLKSKNTWDGKLYWKVYDNNGSEIISYIQQLLLNTDPETNSVLPLLWAGRYSLIEGLGNLGGIFGFVDNKMSLLALERDTLKAAEAALYTEKGVPRLLPQEIFADSAKISIPKENILIDISGIAGASLDALSRMHIVIGPKNLVTVTFAAALHSAATVTLYDLKGRILFTFKDIKVAGNRFQVALPAALKGIYLMRIAADSKSYSSKIVLK
jgi:hypothetical protein